MKAILLLLALCLSAVLAETTENNWENYVKAIVENANLETEQEPDIENRAGKIFNCPSFSRSSSRPTSVHALRPGDIDVIGAIGDSLTAANGAKAYTVPGVLTEYRGVSWSIGGDKDVDSHSTLANIIRKFNPNVYGFSTGTGKNTANNAVFNVAHPGDTSHHMYDQAVELVNRMKTSSKVNFNQDWKLITFFIGGNDLCAWCNDQSKYSPDTYILNLKKTLDYFHANLPRAFINLVVVLDVRGIVDLSGLTCRTMQNTFCACGLDSSKEEALGKIVQEYQTRTISLVEGGYYDNREDFTVVVQPFLRNMKPPTLSNGKADYSYFAPDCFHYSDKGHSAAGVELWNNMLEPINAKSEIWKTLGQVIKCPSEAAPYFYTRYNSRN